mmetsp:Transcript_56912/g.93616  ORF Transcript_56912/g.93616 Transcript_56912/m.93616 type:complete len:105 (+) Transcript_56912:199-513(+)
MAPPSAPLPPDVSTDWRHQLNLIAPHSALSGGGQAVEEGWGAETLGHILRRVPCNDAICTVLPRIRPYHCPPYGKADCLSCSRSDSGGGIAEEDSPTAEAQAGG